MELSLDIETSSFSLQSFQSRYILTKVDLQQICFPAQWVDEIMLVSRAQIFHLPFYDSMLLGVVHHQGNIVPLISSHILLSEKLGQDVRFKAMKETLTVIRLGQIVGKLAGVGIVVEQVLGSFVTNNSPDQPVFQLSDLPSHIWQPN